MTPGASAETADGMSEDKIDQIIEAMRHERYRFRPVRRIYIPKKNGKLRPLGLPSWSDKLVGEVVRLLLEAYYEPTFSDHSHGFRPGRGCHTALREVERTWTGTTWFIEGDISDCFGSLDHDIMVRILSEKIHDNRFLRLIQQMLKAGYLEDWRYHETLSGAPQGGVVSPILSNIYLHKLDVYVETVLIPQYTRGKRRKRNPEYHRMASPDGAGTRARGPGPGPGPAPQLRRLPSGDPQDPGYRRLRYSRYADDHLLGFIGPKAEAEAIKDQLARFLRDDLALELNPDKTLITHARTRAARYLGYEIIVQHVRREDHPRPPVGQRGRRAAGAAGRDQGQTCPLPAPRQTLAPVGPAEPGRLRHRRHVRGRIPGHRRLLPARHRRLAPGRSALARPDVDAEDPGRQAPVHRVEDGRQAPGQDRDPVRAADVLRGQDPPQRQAGPGSPVRRDPPGARQGRGPRSTVSPNRPPTPARS